MSEIELKNKLLIEFIGTFFLTTVICTAAVAGSAGDFAPIAIGLILMVMVYAGGHISGAHYNPAVTLSVYLRGACPKSDVIPYIGTQIIAGVTGAVVGFHVLSGSPDIDGIAALTGAVTKDVLAAEFLFTFALCYVILNVTTTQDGNPFYGAAIGLTVMAGAFTVGGISGGAFNPAVSVALVTSGAVEIVDVWKHFVPQLLAAAAAAFVFKESHDLRGTGGSKVDEE